MIALTDLQWDVVHDPSRFRVWIAGRRSGKSRVGAVDCIETAFEWPRSLSWYIAPTLEDGRDTGWETLKLLIPPEYILAKNETRMSLTVVNYSKIAVKSSDHPDGLVGRGLKKAVFDEYRRMDPGVWPLVRPALSDLRGGALFITSPGGFNHAYDLYMKGVAGEPGWRSWQTTSLQAGIIPPEEIEKARGDMDPRMFRQEYEASFETLEGRVYSNFVRREHVMPLEDDGGDLLVGMDFNVHPMTAVVAVRAGDECHVIDALELPISNTEEMAQALHGKYPGRRIIVCPDPSGRARKTSAPVGQTDFTILQRAGFTVDAPNAAPPVVDRINNVQALLRSADGRRRLLISPKAAPLIRALDGLTYKEGTNLPDKSSGLDHVTDALGYLCWARFQLLAPRAVQRPFAA